MPIMGVQQAFKSAIMGGNFDLDSVDDIAAEAQAFKERMESLLPEDTQMTNAALVAGALAACAVAVQVIYSTISNRMEKVEEEISDFKQLVDFNIAVYLVEKRDDRWTKAGHYVASFIHHLQERAQLFALSGLMTKNVADKGTCYSVFSIAGLPLGASFDSPRFDGDDIDERGQALSFLLDGDYNSLMATIVSNLENSWLDVPENFVRATAKIRDLHATRLIPTVLANIAINLVQGVNPKTKTPFTIYELEKLSFLFNDFLIKLQGNSFEDRTGGRFSALGDFKVLYEEKKLFNFILNLQQNVDALHRAYRKKIKNDLNLNDVIDSGYLLMRLSVLPISKLLFVNFNMDRLSTLFSNLVQLDLQIQHSKKTGKSENNIFNRLIKKLGLKVIATNPLQLNRDLDTVLDFLAIFSSCGRPTRSSAISRFKHKDEDAIIVDVLEYFDSKYLRPIETATDSYVTFIGLKQSNAINPARTYFIAFIALLLEVHNVSGTLRIKEQALGYLKNLFTRNEVYGLQVLLKHEQINSKLQDYLVALRNLVIAIRHLSFITTASDKSFALNQDIDFQKFVKALLVDLKQVYLGFVEAKDALVEFHSDNELPTSVRAIISSIDTDIPGKYTSLPATGAVFLKVLDNAENQLQQSKFDELDKKHFQLLIDRCKAYDLNPSKHPFYQRMKELILPQPESTVDSDVAPYIAPEAETDTLSIGTEDELYDWNLQIFNVVLGVSLGLIAVGIIVLLFSQYAPLDLSMQVAEELFISGLSLTGGGVLGMASSFFVPKVLGQRSSFVPLETSDFQLL